MYIVFKFKETLPEINEVELLAFAVASNDLELLEVPQLAEKLPEGTDLNKRSSNEPIFNYYIDAGTNDRTALEKLIEEFKREFDNYKISVESYTSPSRHPAVYRVQEKLLQLPSLLQRIKQTMSPYATGTNLLFAGAAAGAVLVIAAQYHIKNTP